MQHVNSSNSSVSTHSLPENLVASGVLGMCFALGVPGNIAVLVLLPGWLKGGTFTPRLMRSLAVSDLMTLLPLPVWIWALLNGWVFGLFLCKFLSYVVYWNIYCSVLCVTSLSMQRYMQVLHTQTWAKLRQRGQHRLVTGIWCLSAILASYTLIQRSVKSEEDGKLHCTQHYSSDIERVTTLLLETLVLFGLPFPLLVYFYCRLHQGVKHSTFFNSHRMTNLVARIVVTFFILWIPTHISNIVLAAAVLLGHDGLLWFGKAVRNIAGALTFISSCVNPLLYAFSAQVLWQHTPGSESV
ncbi:apelin receptor B-like [Electrophorus electricus]|uniref:apelin receptor B-like n=1 Tax=Electrophorus electricus TaxID=8005 RepID=UPI0015CFBB74|nr:apelin receptor B-like [Electrophorus electricus]